jgi:hypothetical protein
MLVQHSFAFAPNVHMSPRGNDRNCGSASEPVLSLQAALAKLGGNGGNILLQPGRYRLPLRARGLKNLTIMAENPKHRPIIDPRMTVKSQWKAVQLEHGHTKVDAWVTQLSAETKRVFEAHGAKQVFFGDEAGQLARWPNLETQNLFNREHGKNWLQVGPRTRYTKSEDGIRGTLHSEDMARTGIDWTGATAMLQVAHQFYSWTRTVEGHQAHKNSFSFDELDDSAVTHLQQDDQPNPKMAQGRFFLYGIKEALDAPLEWFYKQGQLWVVTKAGSEPQHDISLKTLPYGIEIDDSHNIRVKNIDLIACG